MMRFNHKHRKCIGSYKLVTSQEMINHLMYMDDMELYFPLAKQQQHNNNDNAMVKTMTQFLEKYTSHFIERVRKGLLKVLL